MAAVDRATVSVNCSGPGGYPLLSKTDFSIAALTAGNFNTQTGAVDSIALAIQPLTLGVVSARSIAVAASIDDSYPLAVANRGQKWILTASNAVGRLFTYTIPAALTAGNVQADNYTADLTSAAWDAFKTLFDTYCVDPDGNALTLLRAKVGGRRR